MKKRIVLLLCCLAIAVIAGLLYSCQSPQSNEPDDTNRHAQVYGHLYNTNRTPAVNAKVTLIPMKHPALLSKAMVTSVPCESGSLTAVAAAEGITDKNGRYSFLFVPADTYNVIGEGNGNVSRIDSVVITSDTIPVEIPDGTLKSPGRITGIVKCDPPMDLQKIRISYYGETNFVFPDSTGHFTIDNLAEGYWPVLVWPVDPNYTYSWIDTQVYPGKVTDLGVITLIKSSGIITGIVKCDPIMDYQKIMISSNGTILGRPDSTGHFSINLARGNLEIRISSVDSNYTDFVTQQNIELGKVTDLGTIPLINWKAGDKAALYKNYLAMKLGVLVHFNMSTFDRCTCSTCYSVVGEWGLANRDPKTFNPSSLNCGQWADAAKAAGANYMILTVKHQDGFCLWNSAATQYDVGSSSWADGKRDVVREFTDSARSRGLQVGFYYSIRDLTNGYSMEFIKQQLTELLSNYGPITCLLFDGWSWGPGYKSVPYATIDSLVKSLQPNCIMTDNNHTHNLQNSEIAEFEIPVEGLPPQGSILPSEAMKPIRTDYVWFWHPYKACDLFTPQNISDDLNLCNSRNANYLLSLCPDTTGQLPLCQVECLKSVGVLRGIQ